MPCRRSFSTDVKCVDRRVSVVERVSPLVGLVDCVTAVGSVTAAGLPSIGNVVYVGRVEVTRNRAGHRVLGHSTGDATRDNSGVVGAG
jgi:hypothetical protein